MQNDRGLSYPWLREQLVDALTQLSDASWLTCAVQLGAEFEEEIDDILDLLDDLSAIDDPVDKVGLIYYSSEVAYAVELGRALDASLGTTGQSVWEAVSAAAAELRVTMVRNDTEVASQR